MGRRFGGHNRKKPPNTILKANNQSDVNPISVVAAESVDSECNSAKLRENVLKVESLPQTLLPTSRKRRTRASINADTAYQCQICHLSFSNVFCLRRHLDHYGDPTYPCANCGTKFTDKKQLQSHVLHTHGHPKTNFIAQCVICKQRFWRFDYLQAHLSHYHENWKESVKTEENPAKRSTEVKSVTIEGLGSTVKIVTASPATDSTEQLISPTSLEDEENKRNDRLREVEQAVSPNAKNVNDPVNRLEIVCQSVDPTRKNEHPISGNSEYRHGLEDSESESNQTMRLSEQSCLNYESSQFLKPRVVDKSYSLIEKDSQGVSVEGEEEYDLQIRLFESEENCDESLKGSENAVPAREQYGQRQTEQIICVKPGKDINKDLESFATVRAESNENQAPVGHETEFVPGEKNANVDAIGGLSNCFDTDVLHHVQVTKKNSQNVTSLDATSGEESTAATSVISQEKARRTTDVKFESKERNYEEEFELRKLYSCKDCYVPLNRIRVPKTSRKSTTATEKMTQSQVQQLHTVIPSVVCDRTFASKDMMTQHYQQQHLRYSDGQMFCVCGKIMSGNEALDFHFYRFCHRTVRSATLPGDPCVPCKPLKPKLSCTGCRKKFWLRSCLRSHMYNCKSVVKKTVQEIAIKKPNVPTVNREQVCLICNSAFRTEEKLAVHTELYSGTTCGCAFCGTKFFGERQLKCHMITAHIRNTKPSYTFQCTICNQRFPEKRYQRMHTMHIHRDKVFENIRKPATSNLSPADLDDLEDKGTSVNKCNVCNIVFSNEKRLIDHTIYYLQSEIIHCQTCGEKFEGQYRAHHHNKAVHYSEHMQRAFTHHCIICKEGFMYMTHLQAHMFHVHTSFNNTTIVVGTTDTNQLVSPDNSSLGVDSLLHQVTDDDVGNVSIAQYACTVCDVKFPTAGLLAEHEMIFTNDGEYLCNRCSRKCQTPAVLLDHVTTNHSNNTIQCGIKCRLCNENFLTQRDWVCHVKHFHSPAEPSEFYLEKNIASPENTGDHEYQLIPTNESISTGVTYLKVKSSIDFPESPATTYSVINEHKVNTIITESEKLISDNHGKTEEARLKLKRSGIRIQKPKDDVLLINNVDEMAPRQNSLVTTRIDADAHKEKSTTINNEQAVNLNAGESQMKMDNPEKKTAKSRFWKIPEAIGRISKDSGWNCSTCGYTFRGPSDLAKHMSLYSNSGPHVCEVCNRRFEVHEFHRVHKMSHVNPKKMEYFCAPCREGFVKYQTMRMHTAHRHSQPPQTLSSEARNKDSVRNHEVSFESLRRSRANAPQVRWPEPSLYRPVLPSIEKNSIVRTYSRKQIEQPVKVVAQVDATKSKHVEKSESPHLYTEIFEDEISVFYECPNCQESYPSVKQLNEHFAAAHDSGHGEKECKEASKSDDTHVVCDICHKVFENNNLLSAHKKRLHVIKSMHVIKSSAPVLEITAPIDGPKCPDNDKPSVVIGRLYKLEEINILPTMVDHAKNDIRKKLTVENISGAHGEHQKVLPITTVQLRTPTGNSVQSPPEASDTQLILQKLNMGQIIFPKPDQQNLQKVDQQKPPKADQPNLSKAEQYNPPNTEQLKKIVRITSMGTANRSALKHIIPSNAKSTTLLPSQLAKPIQIVKVESCSSMTSPTPSTVSGKTASTVTRTITSTVVSTPTSAVTNKATSTVVITPATTVSSKATKTVVRTTRNSVSSKATKTVSTTPRNSVSSKVTIALVSPPVNSVSSKVTKTVVSTPGNSVSSKAEKAIVSTPVNPVSSKGKKIIVSTPVNPVSSKGKKTVVSTPVNPVSSKATSATTTTNQIKFHCQFTCIACNIIFMNRSQYVTHNMIAHSSSSLSGHSIVNPRVEPTSSENSVDKLRNFVDTSEREPESAKDTDEEDPFRLGFESVLIPVSADDFEFFEDENVKSDEMETDTNVPKLRQERNAPPDHYYNGPLKVRSFAKIVQNLKRKTDRKRKDDKTDDILATKRPKGVFDPVAYEELCRQHNLLPPAPKSPMSRSSSNTRKK